MTVDINGWPNWNPNVTKAERLETGQFGVGSQARMTQPGLPQDVWTVTDMHDGQSFVWETKLRGLHLIATHTVTPNGSGTENTLALEAKGLWAFVLLPLIARSSYQTLERENQGLKSASEI